MADKSMRLKYQCTFWCSVLSNLPRNRQHASDRDRQVSMHLLVLSAFRLDTPHIIDLLLSAYQCTFWCSVLSDVTQAGSGDVVKYQCTFWCSVLSDPFSILGNCQGSLVSMHLLVLSAFRPLQHLGELSGFPGINAPSGAQCFPTSSSPCGRRKESKRYQCTFWCSVLSDATGDAPLINYALVSMHLLVLSAFRPDSSASRSGSVSRYQCTFWCSVLSDPSTWEAIGAHLAYQCTFWCSVLSDSAPRKPRHNAVYRNEIATDLESTTSNRSAPVQLNHTTAKNRHKPPQRRRRPLPTSTPPASNEPKPKNRRLTTTPESTSSYWASRILCCKVMPILPAE